MHRTADRSHRRRPRSTTHTDVTPSPARSANRPNPAQFSSQRIRSAWMHQVCRLVIWLRGSGGRDRGRQQHGPSRSAARPATVASGAAGKASQPAALQSHPDACTAASVEPAAGEEPSGRCEAPRDSRCASTTCTRSGAPMQLCSCDARPGRCRQTCSASSSGRLATGASDARPPQPPAGATPCWQIAAHGATTPPEQAPVHALDGVTPTALRGDTGRSPAFCHVTPGRPAVAAGLAAARRPRPLAHEENRRKSGDCRGSVTNRPKRAPSPGGLPRRMPAHEASRRGGRHG